MAASGGHWTKGGFKAAGGASSPAEITYWDEEMSWEYEGRDPYDIARETDIYISNDKDTRFVALDADEEAVAAAFVTSGPDEYSADIVVLPSAQGQGLGSKLLDETISDFRMEQDVFPSSVYRADAVNPAMAAMMKRRGFKEIGSTTSGVELVLE